MTVRGPFEPLLEDEPLIRRYIFGEVSEEERRKIEERLLTDRQYLERLQIIETDLTDQYVRGAFTPEEREYFEKHFLLASKHRQKVKVAAALRSYIASEKDVEATAIRRLPLAPKWSLRPAAAISLIAATLVLAATAGGLLIETVRLRREIHQHQAEAQNQRTQLQALTEQVESAESRRAQLERDMALLIDSTEAQVTLNDGGRRLTLDKEGNLRGLEGLTAALEREIKLALARGKIKAPDSLAELVGTASVLMGPGDGVAFPLLSPVGIAVADQQPMLRWGPLRGATSYTVSVFDQDFRRVLRSEPLKENRWKISQPLNRGAVYSWQVTATRDGDQVTSPVKPAPEARFRVLDEAAAAEIGRAKRAYGNSHLAAGIIYAEAGLKEEAEREFRILVKENPRSSIARRLLRSVQSWNRR